MTPEERRQLNRRLTSMHRLLSGTVLPHLARAPDDLRMHGVLSQIEGMLTVLLERLDEAPEDREVRRQVENMLGMIENARGPRRTGLHPFDVLGRMARSASKWLR